jgi:uncharacterized protein YjcR
MTVQTIRKKRPMPARELWEAYGVSIRTIKRWNSRRPGDWIDEQAATREAIRAYHDDGGHSWAQTVEHFNMSLSAVRQRAYKARVRSERAAEAEEKARHMDGEVPLFD